MITRAAFRRMFSAWWPAALIAAAIFALSSRPADALPDFGWADAIVKKGGHMLGYGMLAVSYWRGLGWSARRTWLAWVLAVVYGLTDELHQSYVPGRGASAWDVMLFDAPGALFGLLLMRRTAGRGLGASRHEKART